MTDGVDGAAEQAGVGAGATPAAGGGDWRELDRTLRRLARRRAADDVEEAACLRRARAEGLHRHFGYASFYEYAERVLGYTPGVVRERMRVADALVGLPKLCAAMTAGDVVYSAARELTRVATAANEDAWLAATARASVRDIEDMVAGRRRGDPPDAPPDPAARLHERRFLLTGAVLGTYIAARARLETACGHPLTDSEVLDALCAASLAGTAATDPATRQPPYQIAITRCADCARAWVDAAGQSIELSATELARASCDAELLGRVDGEAPPRATKTIPPRIRRAVLRRDRGRCRVPGCKNARFVDVHHVVPRGRGGDHAPSRLAAMCSAHHQAAHDGRLKVDLDKRGRLRVAHADGRPYGSQPPPRVAAPGEAPLAPSAPAASIEGRGARRVPRGAAEDDEDRVAHRSEGAIGITGTPPEGNGVGAEEATAVAAHGDAAQAVAISREGEPVAGAVTWPDAGPREPAPSRQVGCGPLRAAPGQRPSAAGRKSRGASAAACAVVASITPARRIARSTTSIRCAVSGSSLCPAARRALIVRGAGVNAARKAACRTESWAGAQPNQCRAAAAKP
jgi:hypothetical protein